MTATDLNDGTKNNTSSLTTVAAGTFAKLQLLVPGETAAPGSTIGKVGTPAVEFSNVPFNVTVNGVDANWNLINTNDNIRIVSSDPSAILPPNAVPAVRAVGAPVLPDTVPGAAISPGIRTCSRAYAPGATVTADLVLVPIPARVMSAAVTVLLPPVLRVTLKVATPLTRGASGGSVALASEEVMWTVSLVLRGDGNYALELSK